MRKLTRTLTDEMLARDYRRNREKGPERDRHVSANTERLICRQSRDRGGGETDPDESSRRDSPNMRQKYEITED